MGLGDLQRRRHFAAGGKSPTHKRRKIVTAKNSEYKKAENLNPIICNGFDQREGPSETIVFVFRRQAIHR